MQNFTPRAYQIAGSNKLLESNRSALLFEMGLGKTASTLMTIAQLIKDLEISKVLIIAPLAVAETVWDKEAQSWNDFAFLKFSKILGSEKERLKALEKSAHIYLINKENTEWLCRLQKFNLQFDCVIIDELSSFRNPQSRRFKCLAKSTALTKRVHGLTGTFAPNGLTNAWAQLYLLDRGERLGRTLGEFRRNWCVCTRIINGVVKVYDVPEHLRKNLMDKISDIVMCVRAEGNVELPDRLHNTVLTPLAPKDLKKYKELEREKILELKNGGTVTAQNAAAVITKLLQIANGSVYYEKNHYEILHDAKLKALEDLVESNEEQSILVAYAFKSDKERILERLKKYSPQTLDVDRNEILKQWNEKKIRVLLVHPASAGHGLNLQHGGHIAVWFGLTFDLELYEQFNARLHRSGQKNTVIIHHLIAPGTQDERVLKVLQRKSSLSDEIQNFLL